jgi:hypothetical protein
VLILRVQQLCLLRRGVYRNRFQTIFERPQIASGIIATRLPAFEGKPAKGLALGDAVISPPA